MNGNVKKVAVGDGFIVALRTDGTVYTWGRNDYGQLGLGGNINPIETANQASPVLIEGIENIVDIAVGANHTLLLAADGTIYGFGDYSAYQVAPEASSSESSSKPQKLYIRESLNIAAVFADNNTSYALTRNGDVVVWGDGSTGEFGKTSYAGHGPMYAETSEQSVTVSVGTKSVMVLSENNKVYGWGNNNYNQLGLETTVDPDTYETVYDKVIYVPTLSYTYNYAYTSATETTDGVEWIPNGITAGESSFVTYQNGHARVLGHNTNYGQLGIDTYEYDILDAAVTQLHAGDSDPDYHYDPFTGAKMIAASANGENGVIYDNIGKIYAWGDNSYGQIGDGTNDTREYPAEVLIDGGGAYIDFSEAELTRNGVSSDITMFYDTILRENGILETAVRQGDMVAIDLDSVIGIIGFTLFGESAYKPVDLTFESINTSVADFTNKNSNNENEDGVLYVGSNTGTTYLIARDSRDNVGIIKLNIIPAGEDSSNVMPMIAVGENHTISLRSDGTVWAWGDNTYGQSGSGSKQSYIDIPVQVMMRDSSTSGTKALTNVIKIAASGNHNLALTSDGHVYAWGTGVKGALGNGSQTELNIQQYASQVYGTTRSYYLGDYEDGTDGVGSMIIDIAAAGVGADSSDDTKQYSFAIDIDGNIYGWGYNYKGVVSPQDTYNAKMTLPRNITGRNTILKGARKLVADKTGETMHILKNDGQIITWGDNSDGVYGIGTMTSTLPSRAVLPEKALAAYAGTGNVMAIHLAVSVVKL
ncbi:MAG: hypothetical protein LIO94_07090, partial [Clostridiales bacterium]|nr:hypothetical protein [Clostridiales bacterium]